MEKIFKSKLAFIAFVIIFTALLLIVYRDPFARIIWSLSVGGLTGFVFAQWYWIAKMEKIQDLLDARMASPEQAELLKRKEEKNNELSDHISKLIARNAELMKEINQLKQAIARETKVPNNPTSTQGKGE